MLGLLITGLKRLRDRRRRRAELIRLERMSDRVLRDIGISRAEIQAEIGGRVLGSADPCAPLHHALALDGRF